MPRVSAPATMPAERGSAPTRGAWLREFWGSTVGKKQIVAVTGAVLVLYVITHMLGNLKAFQSDAAAIDLYGEYLRTVGEPVIPKNGVLWALRAVLLVSFVVHIVAVTQLAARNRAARPAGRRPPVIKRSLSTRTMQIGGYFLALFVVFHILHLTTGTIEPGSFEKGAVFQNMNAAFDSPVFVAIYVLAALALGFHLRHAIWSFFQTGGWDKPNRNPTFRRASNFIAVAVAVGFVAVPVAFWVGVIG
jgi:succinate dehydrogenase / fumarate reductase, cytochrome b subunit